MALTKLRNKEKGIYYPTVVEVELVESWKDKKLMSSTKAEEFNLQALMEAKSQLNQEVGFKVRLKYGKFWTRDQNLKFARRLVGKVWIG